MFGYLHATGYIAEDALSAHVEMVFCQHYGWLDIVSQKRDDGMVFL